MSCSSATISPPETFEHQTASPSICEVEHMWSSFSHMRAILVAPLAHDVPEQDGSLRGVDCVLGCGRKPIKDWSDRVLRRQYDARLSH
jgi:hypothetical protein